MTTKLLTIKEMPKELKIALIKKLGYNSDGKYVLKNGKKYKDKYIGEFVRINNMFIYPGSTIIIDNNPLSISSFYEEFGDVI